MNNLRHSANTRCQCVDRHTTRSLSTDCKPFNIKTSPATPDLLKNEYSIYIKTPNIHSTLTLRTAKQAHMGKTSDQIQLATLSPSQNTHTLKTISNTPKPTITPSSKSLTALHAQRFTAKLTRFLPTRSYFQPSPLVLPTQHT